MIPDCGHVGLLVLTWHKIGWELSNISDSSIPVSLWNSHILTRVGYSCSVTVLIPVDYWNVTSSFEWNILVQWLFLF